ncbi:unnamed protein product [Phytophthora lilii]|uniref:Unnamed protein product n=1 Tax=Phytophthora lilii TaxID=2077276 RepID=A0A9W6TIC2_9STRA|nr:unnamed protein product [Phytophthora lilii]
MYTTVTRYASRHQTRPECRSFRNLPPRAQVDAGLPRQQVCALQARHRLLPGLALARSRSRPPRGAARGLGDVVKDIAAEPATLSPKLLQQLPKALTACQCDITLREHVAGFFADDDPAQQGHRHFLQLLKSWHATLKAVEMQQQETSMDPQSERFEHYYEVLEVDEDYFPDEMLGEEKEAPKKTKTDRKKLFDEAFAEDLRLEVVYFFLELEELVEGVFTIYDQVKKQQRTMVEATVVVKLAMETATALTARLQLRYPALQTAEDVFNIISSKMPLSYRMRMANAVANFWESFQKNGTYHFTPGMLIVDYMCYEHVGQLHICYS